MESIAALKDIDYVAPNTYPNAIQLIKMIRPNIYCKGKDYKNYTLDATNQIKKEAKAIKNVGGRIIHTATELFSSSKIINQSNLNLSNEQKSFISKIKKNKDFNNDSKITNIMNSFSNLKVLVIGETIIDQYNFCEALGKSGKEPYLALKDLYFENYLGGAAAIANNLAEFCKEIKLVSMIGEKQEHISYQQGQHYHAGGKDNRPEVYSHVANCLEGKQHQQQANKRNGASGNPFDVVGEFWPGFCRGPEIFD